MGLFLTFPDYTVTFKSQHRGESEGPKWYRFKTLVKCFYPSLKAFSLHMGLLKCQQAIISTSTLCYEFN